MTKIFNIFLTFFIASISTFFSFNLDNNSHFYDKLPISSMHNLEDFSSNNFKLYELEGGYAIYYIMDDCEKFLEGSLKTQSPYYEFFDFELYYLGPGNYFYKDSSNNIHDILGQKIVNDSILNASYNIQNQNYPVLYSSDLGPISTKTKTDDGGFVLINDDHYFKQLKKFPENYDNSCGIVALSILLGYYDTMYNNDFIPDMSYSYAQNGTTETGKLISQGQVGFDGKIVNYPMTQWQDIPGTSQALFAYISQNYKHIINIPGNNSNPMADGELYNTLIDYMNSNCPQLVSNCTIKYGHLNNPATKIKGLINNGYPACAVLLGYSYNGQQTTILDVNDYHDAIIYGYLNNSTEGDIFLAHLGWNSGTKDYAECYISDCVIYGYFGIEYNGSHVCSNNMAMVGGGQTIKEFCGCGITYHVHQYTYTWESIIQHRITCSCGYNETAPHRAFGDAIYCQLCGGLAKLMPNIEH